MVIQQFYILLRAYQDNSLTLNDNYMNRLGAFLML